MGRFFDATDGGPLRLELRSIDGRNFALLRPIAYAADGYAEPFVVPAHLSTFRTDMASVPWVFTWLVPRSGRFLPAAVLHDALVAPGAYRGPAITRPQADRLFRVAMIDLDTGRIRSWLMWAAVTMATMWDSRGLRWYWRGAVIGLVGVVTVLGILATLDLFDVWNHLPWMGERSFGAELVGGAVGALVVPAALALTWGRFAPAGIITGVALAFLVHVTLAIAVIYTLYWLLERVVSGPQVRRGPPFAADPRGCQQGD